MVIAVIVGLALAVPIVLPPVLFVWYLNSGGITSAIKRAKKTQALGAQRG